MNINPIIFYTIIGCLIIAMGTVVFLTAYVLHLAKFVKELSTELHDQDHSTKRIRHRLQTMYAKALGQNAHALEEVLNAEFKTHMQELEKQEEANMQQVINSFLQSITQGLQQVQKDHVNRLDTISKNIESSALSEIELFKKTLSQETVGTQQKVEQEIKASYQNVLKEIDAYKEQKLKAVDEQIVEILKQVSQEALGKELSLKEHQELIINSLKKAKQEGFFA